MSHASKFLADSAHAAIISDHLDRKDSRRVERRADALQRREATIVRADERRAEANARRADAHATPLSPAMHRAMVVLAVISALTVVGLPITALIAYLLHSKGRAITTRETERAEAEQAEAARHLTDEDRDWMRRHNGQA